MTSRVNPDGVDCVGSEAGSQRLPKPERFLIPCSAGGAAYTASMLKRDPLGDRTRPWMLLILGGLCLLAYQFLTGVIYWSSPGLIGMSMGMILGAAFGVVLPLAMLTRRLGISFGEQFLLRKPDWQAALLTVAATLSMIPALEVITEPFARAFPPPEDYFLFIDRMRPEGPVEGTLLLAGLAVAVPLAEELLFRGLALRVLLRHSSPVLAVILTGLLFGAVHPLFSAPAVALLGVWFGVLVFWSANLGYAILAHAIWNLANLAVLLGTPVGSIEEAMTSPFSGQPMLWLMISLLLFAFFARLLFNRLTDRTP